MDSILVYQDKLNEALTLVRLMNPVEKVEAVYFWNDAAAQFQGIVNDNEENDYQQSKKDSIERSNCLDNCLVDDDPAIAEQFDESKSINCSAPSPLLPPITPMSNSNPNTDPTQKQQNCSVNETFYDNTFFSPDMIDEANQILLESADSAVEISQSANTVGNHSNPQNYTDAPETRIGKTITLRTSVLQNESTHPQTYDSDRIAHNTMGSSLVTGLSRDEDQQSVGYQSYRSNVEATDVYDTSGLDLGYQEMDQSPIYDKPNPESTNVITNEYDNIVLDNINRRNEKSSNVSGDTGNDQFDRGRSRRDGCGHSFESSLDPSDIIQIIDLSDSDEQSTDPCNDVDINTQENRPSHQMQEQLHDCQFGSNDSTTSNSMAGTYSISDQNQSQQDTVTGTQQQLIDNQSQALMSPASSSFRTFNFNSQQGDADMDKSGASKEKYTCELCGKSGFSTKGNLKRHLKAHTGEKPFQCDYCGSKFTENKSLKIHMRKHTGEKPYKCEICDKVFSQTGVLKSHMALHLEERKFTCPKCNKAFRQRSQLKLHLMRHDGIKKLECSNCQARFLTKGDLERHFRTHTGERPYTCRLCGKTFTRQQSLNEHLSRHVGRKPYTCEHCDQSFSDNSAWYKHMEIHKHQDKSPMIRNY